jgi:hypothetical protein
MLLKGSGVFGSAPDVASRAGAIILAGVGVILAGVALSVLAGAGRDKLLRGSPTAVATGGGEFYTGLLLASLAGVLSCGLSLGFVYTYDPIVAAVASQGGGPIAANMAVWAIGLIGGAAVNLGYPAWQMTRHRSWSRLLTAPHDLLLAAWLGTQFIVAVVLMGQGMLWLGVAGAAVGFGIQQSLQLLGNQAVGFASGEWRGVGGWPRRQMFLAVGALVFAVCLLAYGKASAP